MILNLLRVEALKIEEMIKRSFSEHATQQLLPEQEKAVKLSEADLAKITRDPCATCDGHIDACHRAAQDYRQLTAAMYRSLISIPVGRKMFVKGRLIVYMRDGIRTPGILNDDLQRVNTQLADPEISVLEIRTMRPARDNTDILPFLAPFRRMMTPLPNVGGGGNGNAGSSKRRPQQVHHKVVKVPLSEIECLCDHVTSGILPEIFLGGEAMHKARDQLRQICRDSWKAGDAGGSNNNGGRSIWDEMSLSKVTNLHFVDLREKRQTAYEVASTSPAVGCWHFVKHVSRPPPHITELGIGVLTQCPLVRHVP